MFASPCCCNECLTYLNEDFSGSDGSFSDPDWTVISGTWNRSSNALTTASANAIIIANFDNPDGLAESEVTVSANGGSGCEYGIILDWVDTNNYLYAKFIPGGTGFIELRQVAGGGDTILNEGIGTLNTGLQNLRAALGVNPASVPTNSTAFGTLYNFIADNGGQPTCSIRMSEPRSGLRVGIRTGANPSGVTFDNFLWGRRSCLDLYAYGGVGWYPSGNFISPRTDVIAGTWNGFSPTSINAIRAFRGLNQEDNGYQGFSVNISESALHSPQTHARVFADIKDASTFTYAEFDGVNLNIGDGGGQIATAAVGSGVSQYRLGVCYSSGKLRGIISQINGGSGSVVVNSSYGTSSSGRGRVGYGTGGTVTTSGGISFNVSSWQDAEMKYDGSFGGQCF